MSQDNQHLYNARRTVLSIDAHLLTLNIMSATPPKPKHVQFMRSLNTFYMMWGHGAVWHCG